VGNGTRPLQWFLENVDAMGLALFATLSTAMISAFLKGHRGVMFLVGLLSAFMLTGMSVPIAAIYWSLHWAWWPVIGCGIGLTSLSLMWFAIRFADRAAQRAPDLADGLGRRWVPEAPDAPRDGGKQP
jgi:hypothetical protein